jgi:endonuclease III
MWEEIYALTRAMRNENLAPVDTMGCESLAERSRTPREQRFQTLIALMLSSQTKDTVTAVAMKGMQDKMPGVSTSSRSTRPSLKSTGLQPRISPGSRAHRTQRLHQ